MRKGWIFVVGLFLGGVWQLSHVAAADKPAAEVGAPQYDAKGNLVRPEGYRQWVYLSSGYGMSYSQGPAPEGNLNFTNVFVAPGPYEYFVKNGTWPDKTMFVLEIFNSSSKGSINVHGSYQKELVGLDVEVKDEKKNPDKWAYYGFDAKATSSEREHEGNSCWKCHDQNAAVEHSFVQFYPDLLKIAKEKKTIKAGVGL